MSAFALARNAMNSRFEIVLHGDDPARLRAIAEEALDEVSRLEAQLSAYLPTSELTQINTRAAREPVRVEPRLFRLLQHAQQLWHETGGAFDLTIGPLMRCWGLVRDTGRRPEPAELEAARACVGMNLVELDESNLTVRFARPGVMLDPGAIGKGHALDVAARVIREAEVGVALLHGGTSTVLGIGAPPGEEGWKIAVEQPRIEDGLPVAPGAKPVTMIDQSAPLLATVSLKDESLSVSAVWGKGFTSEGRFFGHVIDPRLDEPVDAAWLAAVVTPSATDSDALSTALLTLGAGGVEIITKLRPRTRTLVLSRDSASEFHTTRSGL